MGNCQATEAATVVIQHPDGKVERLYWPTSAEEVMKSNPGHYVAVVTLYISQEKQQQENNVAGGDSGGSSTVRFTRVRLLKPKDTLLLGHVYRLVTSQEVTKALRARKHEKIKKTQSELIKKQQQQQRQSRRVEQGRETEEGPSQLDSEKMDQVAKQERDRQKSTTASAARSRQWRPSLQSISEAGS